MEISDDPFAGDRYTIQGGVGTALAFFGISTPSYRVFDEQGRLVLAAEVPALSAREIVLYADEKMLEPVLALVQRNQGNFGRIFDVFDARSEVKLGALRARLFCSVTGRHEILDADDRLAGSIAREPRRGVAGIFSATQIYRLELGAVPAARFFHDTARASANYAVELSPLSPRADARFVIACALVVHIDKYQ